jgi:hypothetical protein
MEPGASQKLAWNASWQKSVKYKILQLFTILQACRPSQKSNIFGTFGHQKLAKMLKKVRPQTKTSKNTKKYQNVVKMKPQKPPRGTLKVIKKPPCPPLGPQMGQKRIQNEVLELKIEQRMLTSSFMCPKILQKFVIVPPL